MHIILTTFYHISSISSHSFLSILTINLPILLIRYYSIFDYSSSHLNNSSFSGCTFTLVYLTLTWLLPVIFNLIIYHSQHSNLPTHIHFCIFLLVTIILWLNFCSLTPLTWTWLNYLLLCYRFMHQPLWHHLFVVRFPETTGLPSSVEALLSIGVLDDASTNTAPSLAQCGDGSDDPSVPAPIC